MTGESEAKLKARLVEKEKGCDALQQECDQLERQLKEDIDGLAKTIGKRALGLNLGIHVDITNSDSARGLWEYLTGRYSS
jgi:hypothetical protein